MRSYAFPVSISKLFAVLGAVALLFAPAMTGAAYAATAQHNMAGTSMRMMDGAPCKSVPASADDGKAMANGCCMAMCMAVAIAPSMPGELPTMTPATATFALSKTHKGYLGEIATPPPRRS